MLKKIVHKYYLHRHFWREVGFDELSELYISNMLHTLAIAVLMVFVPFYMYQHGYTPSAIFALFGFYFLTRIFFDFITAFTVARIGPKHTLIISCFLQISAAALLLTVPNMHWSVWVIGIPWGASASFFFIAYHTAFSKVKHTLHSGKELGYMQIMDKIGGVIGPVIGGLAGNFLGGRYIFLIATLILIASLWPLFRTSEPVEVHQKLNYYDLPLHKIKRDLVSYIGLGIENTLCINLWPFYVSLFALSGSVYFKLGLLSSIAVLVSILSAYGIGRIADAGNARSLLRMSAVVNAVVYAWRPFVTGITGVLATNVANEVVTTGYRLPYTKGFYAAADDLPGFRIVYISSMEAMASIVKCTAWFLLALLATVWSAHTVLIIGFVIASIGSLIITTERFRALSPKRYNVGSKA